MRKQNNNFQLNSGGAPPESPLLDTITDTLANDFERIKYSSYFSIVIFITLVITFLIIISKFIYNLRSELINAHNTQKLCKQEIYENETTRNKLYNLLLNKNNNSILLKNVNGLLIGIGVAYGLYISIFLYNKYISKITVSFDYGIQLTLFIILLIVIIGYFILINNINQINEYSVEYSSNLEFLKDKVFTPENLNQVILSYNRANSTTSTSSTSTQGPLVTLEESIMRRLLHLDQSGEILSMEDAKTKYNNLRITDSGRIDLMGYIQFIRNTEDYNLLQKIVCGTNLCNQGIGYHIKNLPDKDFNQFINDLSATTRPSTDNNAYTTWLNTLKTKVTKYDTELAKQLSELNINDTVWPLIVNIKTKDDIQQCDCKGNPLNIETTADKVKVLSILNYLANLSNGNNIVDVQQKVDNLQYYLIVFYSILFYILFHITYKIFDSKLVIGSYFGILLIISVSLVLVSRL